MYIKKGIRLLALLLCVLFLFAGCGGEDDKPFLQLCDMNIGGEPTVNGLQDSGENRTRTMLFTDFDSYQSTRDELLTSTQVELPEVKEKEFEEHAYLLLTHVVSSLKDYLYQVQEISVNQETLFVQSRLMYDPEQWGAQMTCYRVVLVKLDKELVKDVQKVSVETESVQAMFRDSSDSLM